MQTDKDVTLAYRPICDNIEFAVIQYDDIIEKDCIAHAYIQHTECILFRYNDTFSTILNARRQILSFALIADLAVRPAAISPRQ